MHSRNISSLVRDMAPSILVDESQYLKSQLDLLRRELEQQVATSREAAELATQKIKLKDQWINHLENANTAANTGGNEIVELHAKGRELQGQVVALNERNIDLEEKASMLEEKSSALQEKNSTLKDRNRILVERNRALEEEASALECEVSSSPKD